MMAYMLYEAELGQKPKLHYLMHLATNMRDLGPAPGFCTERMYSHTSSNDLRSLWFFIRENTSYYKTINKACFLSKSKICDYTQSSIPLVQDFISNTLFSHIFTVLTSDLIYCITEHKFNQKADIT